MSGGHHVEREWLDLVAESLETRSLSEERIVRLQARPLSSDACAFSRADGGSSRHGVWPPDLFGDRAATRTDVRTALRTALQAALRAADGTPADLHPVLRYCIARGWPEAMQLRDVPRDFTGPWRASGWHDLCRSARVHQQIAIPVRIGAGGHRMFVTGRDRPYTDAEMALARTLQRLLASVDRRVREPGTTASGTGPLTGRETAVLRLAAEGHTASSAARRLRISERTVHKHLQRVHAKLEVHDRVSAVREAVRRGLLPP